MQHYEIEVRFNGRNGQSLWTGKIEAVGPVEAVNDAIIKATVAGGGSIYLRGFTVDEIKG